MKRFTSLDFDQIMFVDAWICNKNENNERYFLQQSEIRW